MKYPRLTLVLFWILTRGSLAAEPAGAFEAEVRQGELYRLASSWRPSQTEEARWWWRPESGGSAWVRVGWLQLGPLRAAAGEEGARAWAPATTSPSGQWGAAFESPWGGLWAVQKPESLEAGAQGSVRWGPLHAAAGADRTWDLSGQGAPTDRGRAGLSWSSPGIGMGTQVEAGLAKARLADWKTSARANFDGGPVEAGVSGSYASTADWSTRARLAWVADTWGCTAIWDSETGRSLRGRVTLGAAGLLGTFEGSASLNNAWTLEAGLSVSSSSPHRWSVGWTVSKGESLVHCLTGLWKQSDWEAGFSWKADGTHLGWLGPGSTINLTVRRWF